tara:strand:- start:555 stop:929 length:375 start_codon:yes stop_codon:yes gene_type:complete
MANRESVLTEEFYFEEPDGQKPKTSIKGTIRKVSVPRQRAFISQEERDKEITKKAQKDLKKGDIEKEKILDIKFSKLDKSFKERKKDEDLAERYGKDVYKARSFGVKKFSKGGLVYDKKFSGVY